MGYRVLCERHNNALEPLDSVMGPLYDALHEDQVSLYSGKLLVAVPDSFTLISGQTLELWLLKYLWGAMASGVMQLNGSAVSQFRKSVSTAALAEILWRGEPWPEGWGLRVPMQISTGPVRMKSINLSFQVKEGRLISGSVTFGSIEIGVGFGPVGRGAIYRPGAIVLGRQAVRGNKTTALAWPDPRSDIAVYTRAD